MIPKTKKQKKTQGTGTLVRTEEEPSTEKEITEKNPSPDLETESTLDVPVPAAADTLYEEQNSFLPPPSASSPLFLKKFLDPNFMRKKLLPVAAILLVAFLLVIFIKFIFSFESTEKKELRESISIAYESLEQAETFLLQGERIKAQEFLDKAYESAQKVAKGKSKLFRSDLALILAQVEDKQLQVENAKKVTPNLVTDLGLKEDNLRAQGILELKGNYYVNDAKKVFKTVSNIVEKGLSASEKETIMAEASRPDQNLLLYLTNGPRIIEYKEGVITPMNTADESWKSGIDIRTYGRYSYVLDPVNNQIWKYERKRTNYSSAVAYSDGTDLSRAISFSIDGSIYILTDEGTIMKLFRGKKVDYDFKDLPSNGFSGKQLRLHTTAELDFIYILDPENQRILVFVKGDRYATYKKQILYGDLDVRNFSIDELGQKVHILTDDKIYNFSL